jgi:hypothetical protein
VLHAKDRTFPLPKRERTMDANAIDRREALKRVAAVLGGVVSLPTTTGLLSGCSVDRSPNWSPKALTDHQNELVITITEHIIPETDTPGAKGAKVNQFIDTMLADGFLPKDRSRFLEGLKTVDARAEERTGQRFLESPREQQIALLEEMDREAFGEEDGVPTGASFGSFGERPDDDPDPPSFFRMMKELTLTGYYTSEVGATKELKYDAVMGRYEACIAYEEIGRSWA